MWQAEEALGSASDYTAEQIANGIATLTAEVSALLAAIHHAPGQG